MLVAVGIFFIYEMFTVGDFGIAVNWNFFTSAWFWPIIYGCLIYYPLMCVFALLGLILPYALAVILLAIPVLFFLSEKYTQNLRFRSAILIVVTLLLTVGLGWA